MFSKVGMVVVRVKSSREAITEKQGSGEPTKEDQASKKRKGESHVFWIGAAPQNKETKPTNRPTNYQSRSEERRGL